MKKEAKTATQQNLQKSKEISVLDGLMFSHSAILKRTVNAKTKDGKISTIKAGQMVSVYKHPKTGQVLYYANDGRHCWVYE